MSSKRPAPRTPDQRPSKRRATSSPEEGELDDTPPSATGVQPLAVTTSSAAMSKPRVPFPFKNNKTTSSRQEEFSRQPKSRDTTEWTNRDHRDRFRDWSQDERSRNTYRPSVIYERIEEDRVRHREDDTLKTHERHSRPTPSGGSNTNGRWRTTGDHYAPQHDHESTTMPHNGDTYIPHEDDKAPRSRNGGWGERDKDRTNEFVDPPRDDYYKPSLSRGRTPPTRSTTPLHDERSHEYEKDRTKHRLPTPRSSLLVSPEYTYSQHRDRDWNRGDHYEPYTQDNYYERNLDSREHYHRDDLDDTDRYYRPIDSFPEHELERRRYSRSPVYCPSTPLLQRPSVAPTRTPVGRPHTPPLIPPSDLKPEPPDSRASVGIAQTHGPASYPLKRPDAPLVNRTPQSLNVSTEKDTPVPPIPQPRSDGTSSKPEVPPPLIKKKRIPVKRSREEEKEVYQRVFVGCGKRSDYDIMTKLGEGTFGEVHKAINKHTGDVVALKRILMHNEKEGMPVTALREIKILKALRHPCIVGLLDMFVIASNGKDAPMSVYMVFPYMDHDLAGLLENERVKLSPSQIKLYMKQLLEGTEYMHHNNILHRDMKAANLLISNSGSLKIADFGLARAFDPTITTQGGRDRRYTNCVVTRWYRPPELLLGARQYGGEIDIWGIGCVLGEMFMRRPILPGNSDLDQLEKIWSICGSPNQQNWPDYDKLPGCEGQIRFRPQERRIKQVYESLGKETYNLLDKLLTLNPRERITASEALDDEYFWSDPLPADPKSLPTYEASHEYDQRGRRQQHQNQPAQLDFPSKHPGLPPPLHNFKGNNFRPHNQRGPPIPYQQPVPRMPNGNQQVNVPFQNQPGNWNVGSFQAPVRNNNIMGRGPNFPGFHPGPRENDRRNAPMNSFPQLPPRPPGLPARPEGPVFPRAFDPSSQQSYRQRPDVNIYPSETNGGNLNYG